MSIKLSLNAMADPAHDLPIEPSLIQDTKSLAQELNIPWSRLISVALQDFMYRYHGHQKLTDRINVGCANLSNEEDQLLQRMRSTHRSLVEGEW